jgi:GNAT superfamily N-acetyltransferase
LRASEPLVLDHLTRERGSAKKRRFIKVKIRKATKADKALVVEISMHLWGGHDYLPEVWDQWVADPKGRLITAMVNGKAVGVAHGWLQTPYIAWLEGVRVHQQYRGLGIAGKLNNALVEWARKKGARVARLSTHERNRASRDHLKKIGFPVWQTFQRLDSSTGPWVKPAGVSIPTRSSKLLWKWLHTRPNFDEYHAMYSDGWTWHPLTRQVLGKHMTHGNVLVTTRGEQPTSCCIVLDEDKTLTMGFVAGESREIAKLIRMARFWMFQKKREKLRIMLPSRSPLVRGLERSGFKKTAKILVYEKFLG